MLVYRDVAEENGWALGDEVPAEFASSGDVPLAIVGIYDENRLVGDYVISLDTYEGLYSEQLDAFVLVKGAEGVRLDEVEAAIEGRRRGVPQRAGAGPGGVPRAAGGVHRPAARRSSPRCC